MPPKRSNRCPTNLRRVLSASVFALILSGCASVQPVSFSDIVESNRALRQEIPPPLPVNYFDADCTDPDDNPDTPDGLCELPEATLAALAEIIVKLQQDRNKTIEASNGLVDSLNHCEYANEKYRQTIELTEKTLIRNDIISAGKQIVLGAACAALLWAK